MRNPPVLPRMAGETIEVTEDGVATEWNEVSDFINSGSRRPRLHVGLEHRCRSASDR